MVYRGVVQMARTLVWGTRGRSFKSSHPDQLDLFCREDFLSR